MHYSLSVNSVKSLKMDSKWSKIDSNRRSQLNRSQRYWLAHKQCTLKMQPYKRIPHPHPTEAQSHMIPRAAAHLMPLPTSQNQPTANPKPRQNVSFATPRRVIHFWICTAPFRHTRPVVFMTSFGSGWAESHRCEMNEPMQVNWQMSLFAPIALTPSTITMQLWQRLNNAKNKYVENWWKPKHISKECKMRRTSTWQMVPSMVVCPWTMYNTIPL